jgi:hypothetical protein
VGTAPVPPTTDPFRSHMASDLLSFLVSLLSLSTAMFSEENVIHLAQFCDEFLVHGVDVEGKQAGIQVRHHYCTDHSLYCYCCGAALVSRPGYA